MKHKFITLTFFFALCNFCHFLRFESAKAFARSERDGIICHISHYFPLFTDFRVFQKIKIVSFPTVWVVCMKLSFIHSAKNLSGTPKSQQLVQFLGDMNFATNFGSFRGWVNDMWKQWISHKTTLNFHDQHVLICISHNIKQYQQYRSLSAIWAI